jgi:DNA-binding MarR family transcriptional regulator
MSEFLDLHGKTNKLLRALSETAMARHGVHLGQNYLLTALSERDGSTPGEIAAALNVATPTVVKMATRMAAVGLITRRAHEDDKRLVRLWLTKAGRALLKPLEAERQHLEEKVTAHLTETERKYLLKALEKIHRAASELLRDSE